MKKDKRSQDMAEGGVLDRIHHCFDFSLITNDG